MAEWIRPTVCLYPEDTVPVLTLDECHSELFKVKREGQSPIASTHGKGEPFCTCCGGETDILDVKIGWKTKQQPNSAQIESGVRIAMCEHCRYDLAHTLWDS